MCRWQSPCLASVFHMVPNNKMRDLVQGIPTRELVDGIQPARVGDEEVLVVKRGTEVFAIGAHCTHYHGPLADGLLVGDTIRCPWHHACFSVRTGEAIRAPALDPVACWRVERSGETVIVREKLSIPGPKSVSSDKRRLWPESVVIVGGGAAGLAAADMLIREGYDRPITMLSADEAPPCDRPNLSKDYLAGKAPEDWAAARNILGFHERFDAVPFFWSQHYDVVINYVGHAESWDKVDIDGRLEDHDCAITYRRGNEKLAVATVFRDRVSLEAEAEMEHARAGAAPAGSE